MKKLFAILLAVAMMATLALPVLADGNNGTTTIYCDISGSGLSTQVYAYAWENGNSANYNAIWPGVQMTLVEGTTYKIELSSGLNMVIFNNGNNGNLLQSDDLTVPTDGKNLYSYSAKAWSTYGSAAPSTSCLNKPAGDYTIGVDGKYVSGSAAAEQISVDIAWEAMSFTYTAGGSSYDSTTHVTTTTPGAWSSNKAAITVTNHSNVPIDAYFDFTGENGIKGTFTKSSVTVESANDAKYQTPVEGVYPAPSDKTEFGIDPTGPAISADASLGTITVTLTKSRWTLVSTIDELATALAADIPLIKLMADISTDDYVNFNNYHEIDLNGHKLSGKMGYSYNPGDGVDLEIKNGTIELKDTWHVGDGRYIVITDCTITTGTINVQSGGTLVLTGTINLEHEPTTEEGSSVVCSDGTFNFDPSRYIDWEYSNVSDNNNGTWTVTFK